jgi:hypothetical protein
VRALEVNRHAALAAIVCAIALLAACLGARADGAVTGTAVSATPRADIEEPAAPADTLFPLEGPAMVLAREIAERHWGGAACSGEVEIGWASLEPGTNATASWRNPTDAWNNAGENFDCSIDFNTQAEFDWPKLCSVMAHEVGHLLGRQHAGDPNDVMAPLYRGPLDACAQTADPARPAPPVEPVAEERATVAEVAAAPRPRRTRSVAEMKLAVKKRIVAEKRLKRCRAVRRALGARRFGRRARLARASATRLRCTFPRAARRPLLRR